MNPGRIDGKGTEIETEGRGTGIDGIEAKDHEGDVIDQKQGLDQKEGVTEESSAEDDRGKDDARQVHPRSTDVSVL